LEGIDMMHEHTRACVILLAGWIVLSFVALGYGQSVWGNDNKKITVVDGNGVPVGGAKVYEAISFAWDEAAQAARWVPTRPLDRTDANGVLFLTIARLGNGRVYLFANDSLDLMASLYVPRRDPGEPLTIRLERPARLRAIFESRQVAMSQPDLSVGFYLPEKRAVFGLITVTYAFPGPVNQVPLDVPCPSGCHLELSMSAQGGIFPVSKKIPPLKPGQVLDLDTIEPHLTPESSVFKLAGQVAPELQVAEWVKGEPVTLAELKGKVVLLDFWALWCGPCCRALPGLALLHEKYAKDGLVIIAIHDASQTKASLLAKSPGRIDLSKLPFRIAMDSPVEGSTAPRETPGTGRTIDAYGITGFPTTVLLNKKGQVEGEIYANLEDRVHSLLYGRPTAKPTTVTGRLLAEDRDDFIRIGIAAGLILVLAIVLISLFLWRAKHTTRES
jgi:thiol-disulfide isomerase/thioredoxin